jgi:hypothetical protein
VAEVVDGLIIKSEFDDEGLSESEQAQIQAVRELVAAINQQANQLEPLELDVGKVASALEAIGVDTREFFQAYVAGAAQAVDAAELVASATRAIPAPAPPTAPPNAEPPGPPPDLLARFRAFYDTLGELARQSGQTQAAELRRFADEAADVLDLPSFNTDESVRELSELEATFAPLAARIEQFDPAGNLQRMAVAAHGAVVEMRSLAEATTGVTTASARLAAVPPVAAGGGGAPPNDPPKGPTPDQIAGAERMAEALRDETVQLIALATATDDAAAAQQRFQSAQAARVSSAEALVGSTARLAGLSRELSAEDAQRAIVAIRAGAAAAQAAQAQATAAGQSAAAMRVMDAAAREAAEGVTVLTVAEQANVAASRNMIAGMSAASGQTQRFDRIIEGMSQSGYEAAQAQVLLGKATSGAGKSGLEAVKGFGRIQNSLVGLASAAAGIPGPIGNIAGSLLQLAVGGGVVAGVAAGIGIIIVAYRELTRETREAQEATEQYVQSLVKAAGTRDPYAEMTRQLDGIPGKIEGITAAQIRLNQELGEQLRLQALNKESGNANFFSGAIEDTRRQLADIETALQEGAKQRAETIFREVATAMAAQRQAQEQAINDDLALQRTGFQARESALRSAFAREQITAEQFYAERVQIAREAGAAEIDALEASRDALDRAVPGEKPEAVAARAEQVAHLNRVIALRRAELDLAVQQVREEAALTALQRQRVLLASLSVEPPETLAIPVDLKVRTDATDIAKGLVDSAGLEVAGREAKEAQDQVNRLNTRLSITTGILGRIGEGAENIGLIGDNAQNAIVGVLGLIDSLGQLKVANEAVKAADAAGDQAAGLAASIAKFSAIGGVIGAGISAVTGIVGAVQGLFGGDDTHKRFIEEQLRQIAENTAADTERFAGIGGRLELAQQIEAVNVPRLGFREDLLLQEFGTTMEDVIRIADQFNLDVVSEEGHLSVAALELLREEILRSAEALTRFRENIFSDQLSEESLRSRLEGVEQTAEERLRQQLEAAATVGATALTEFFAGVDLGNEAALKAAATNLLEAFDAGLLDLADLGGLDRNDIIAIIEGSADALDELRKSTEAATKSMLNIPTGFKVRLDQLIFEKSAFGPPEPEPPRVPNIPIPAELPTPTFDPHQLPQVPVEAMSAAVAESIPDLALDDYLATISETIPAVPLDRFLALLSEKLPVLDPARRPVGSDGGALPIPGTNVNVTFAAGSIVQRQGEDSVAFARRVAQAVRDIGFNQTGDTQSFGPV